MNQRFTLDRRSFEQFLAALSLVQQLKRQAAYQRALHDPKQPFFSLLQLQRAINASTVDLSLVMAGVIKLTRSVVGASSAGVWLFRNKDEFSCCAHIGGIHDPDRLGADILAQLAGSHHPDSNSCAFSPTLRKASHYPGSPNSVAIATLRVNEKIVGAVAAFSSAFEAFSSRDLDNLRFLAGLLEQALQKAIEAGYRDAIALEHAALRKLAERISPQLSEFDRQPSRSRETRAAAQQVEDFSLSAERDVYRRLPQQAPFPHTFEATEISPRSGDPRATDISLPGVGVRAALGDVREFSGDESPSFLWETVRNGSVQIRRLATQCRTGALTVVTRTARSMRNAAAHVARIPRLLVQRVPSISFTRLQALTLYRGNLFARISNWRLKVRIMGLGRVRPSNWLPFDSPRAGFVGSRALLLLRSFAVKARTLLANSRNQFTYFLRLTTVQARSLRREFGQKRANLSAVVAHERMRVRIAHRRQKNMLTNSAELTGEALQHAGESLAEVASAAGNSTIAGFSTLKGQVVGLKRPRLNARALRRSAGAMGVLAVMAIFLALQAGVRHSLEHVNAASVAAVAIPSGPAALADTTAELKPESGPSSHLEITDASVADTLHDLTRYEIGTLQRAADYGDDEAALQLGMAYETGYYVRQNCSKAAHWVKVAAESGNPAAAYNLALRYRTGDGLPADVSAAEHWLRVASSRQYSSAKLALAAGR